MRHLPFPDDLVRAQAAWTRTYEDLARPHTPGTAGVTALRRRLIRLSAAVYYHPYWAQSRPASGRPELVLQARAARHTREEGAA
ncbi:hypothetical protein [Streptomyces sp. NPDC002057]|uniref:hypothetical protein n=1 Tax=Streptomyces sp. NPDC002057 TaxID=3154664 RepID=UPI0033303665